MGRGLADGKAAKRTLDKLCTAPLMAIATVGAYGLFLEHDRTQQLPVLADEGIRSEALSSYIVAKWEYPCRSVVATPGHGHRILPTLCVCVLCSQHCNMCVFFSSQQLTNSAFLSFSCLLDIGESGAVSLSSSGCGLSARTSSPSVMMESVRALHTDVQGMTNASRPWFQL